MPKYEQPEERVTGIKIPDDDAKNWIEVYQRAGFSNEQIDEIMLRLNDTYLHKRFEDFIEHEVAFAVEEIEQRTGRRASDELRDHVRRRLMEYMRSKRYDELQLLDKKSRREL